MLKATDCHFLVSTSHELMQYGTFCNKTYPKPSLISGMGHIKIKDIRVQGNLVLILSKDGMVYAWGSDKNGLLGIKKSSYQPKPHPNSTLIDYTITQITLSESRAGAMDSQGRVFSWGGSVSVPTLAKLRFKASKIVAFGNKLLALCESEKVMGVIEPDNSVHYVKEVTDVWTTETRAVLKVS